MSVLYIVIPAYNESANIKKTIEQWYPIVEKYNDEGQSRLVVINDGSKDNTYELLCACAKDRPLLVPLTKPNGGHGPTLLYGYRYAVDQDADYIFQTDSDGQTLPEEFGQFWQRRKAYEMVIGHRKGRQDGASRVFVTKMLRLVIRICFHVTVTDANTPYRLMRSEALDASLELIPESFNLSNVMISVIFAKKQLPVRYIPITFRPRQGGVNSINLKKICKIGRQAVRDFREMNRKLAGAAEKD